MSYPGNEVASDNQRRRMEGVSKPPVGGVIENVISVARPALAVGSAVVASGTASATGLVFAGGIVGGLGIVDFFRKLGSSKVNENLESLGQATEDALKRVEDTLLEHGITIEEIKARIESDDFKDGMASAALQALRTTNKNRLDRMALLLANGVKEGDLELESLDDMMRDAVELKDWDIQLLSDIYNARTKTESEMDLYIFWKDYWNEFSLRYPNKRSGSILSAFARLESHGLIFRLRREAPSASLTGKIYQITDEGTLFYERLQEIAVQK